MSGYANANKDYEGASKFKWGGWGKKKERPKQDTIPQIDPLGPGTLSLSEGIVDNDNDDNIFSPPESSQNDQKTQAAALIKQSLGEPDGYLKVTASPKATVWRYASNVNDGHVRNNVGEAQGKLEEDTVISYYKVKDAETTNNRYYIQWRSHVGWIDKSAVTKTEETPDDTANINTSVNPRTINYKQYDSRWAKIKYGKKFTDYSHGGCGPTSMANILVQFGHKEVTPVEVGELSVKWGTRQKGGTSPELFTKAAEYYGIPYPVHYDPGSCKTGLEVMKGRSGKYAIAYVKSSKWGNGHFLTIYGYDGQNVYIDDPNTWNEKDNAASFLKNDIKKERGMWVFG